MVEINRSHDPNSFPTRRRLPGYGPLPAALRADVERQAGMVNRQRLVRSGADNDVPRTQVCAGRWQRVHPRVYATFTGPLSREAQLWAGLLYAGTGATLSHETAAEVWGLVDMPGRAVHVTIPVSRRVVSLATVRIHYANRLDGSRHPSRVPPVVTVEETVLDLIDRALHALLSEVSEGAHSPLEVAFVQRVERPHSLPPGRRLHHRHAGKGTQWLDVWYEAFNTVVELDGRVGHTEEGRFRDHRRDNITTVRGCDSLRYGWADTVDSSCQVAAEVAHVLRANGWDGHPRPCGSRCTAGRSAA